MRKKFLIVITLLVIISITLNVTASRVDRDFIVVYKQKIDKMDEDDIKNTGGNINNAFHIIPAVSTRLSDQAVEKLKKNPRVAYIENDTILTASVDEYSNSWGVSHIGSQIVHNQKINGTGVKIAVLDTGIDYNHEDLKANYMGGVSYVQDINGNIIIDPFDDSYNSHGTHVAGIIAAKNNGIGVVGVAPGASIYSVKVLDGAGFGSASWAIAGLQWAVDNKMDIATMSFGSSPFDPDLVSLRTACDNAYNAGVLLVASAGNTNGGNVTYPAGFDSVIAVTATDQNDQKASFSPVDPKIELAAPGVNINSTIKGTYGQLSGTSQAAPHVTGTAALLISSHNLSDLNRDGVVNNKDVRLQMQRTAKDLGPPGKDDTYGYGLVDAQAAVLGITEQQKPMTFNISRTSGSESEDKDSKTVSLSGAIYQITIRNHGLKEVEVDIFDQRKKLSKLSRDYEFNRLKPQELTFKLNVSGKSFDVRFTPDGKTGTSAEIIIVKK